MCILEPVQKGKQPSPVHAQSERPAEAWLCLVKSSSAPRLAMLTLPLPWTCLFFLGSQISNSSRTFGQNQAFGTAYQQMA